jgi:hypothetical protein
MGEVVVFSLIKLIHWRGLVAVEGVSLVTAFVIAELFYKFHSFALETLAFLATWLVIAVVLSLILPASLQPKPISEGK